MSDPIRTPRLSLRAARPQDTAPLARLLADAAVARWWPDFDEARVRAELVEVGDDEDVTVYVIERTEGGEVVGAIQYSEELDPQYRHAGIDMFLGAAWHGQGFGPEAIRAVVAHLIDARGHHRIVIDPAASNTPAIRAYAKVGFQRVGVMRQYERGADGTFHDGVLMELLADEFRAAR